MLAITILIIIVAFPAYSNTFLVFFEFVSFFYYRKNYPQTRIITFGVLWFFITLSTESSIIPIIDVIFEHRVYLPSIGMLTAITIAVFWIADGCRRKWKNAQKVAIISFIVIVIVFTAAAYKQHIKGMKYGRIMCYYGRTW